MKKYDFFNGSELIKVDEEWLEGVNLNGLTAVYAVYGDSIRCAYEDGKEVFYQNICGTWGNPTVLC